jgi:hypothetical protein
VTDVAASTPRVRPTISGRAARRVGINHCHECGDRIRPDETLRTEVVELDAPETANAEIHEQVRAVHPDCRGDADGW